VDAVADLIIFGHTNAKENTSVKCPLSFSFILWYGDESHHTDELLEPTSF